jgi:hypothetical protein
VLPCVAQVVAACHAAWQAGWHVDGRLPRWSLTVRVCGCPAHRPWRMTWLSLATSFGSANSSNLPHANYTVMITHGMCNQDTSHQQAWAASCRVVLPKWYAEKTSATASHERGLHRAEWFCLSGTQRRRQRQQATACMFNSHGVVTTMPSVKCTTKSGLATSH